MRWDCFRRLILCTGLAGLAVGVRAQVPAAAEVRPNLSNALESVLRYRPDDGDFVIVNGREFFNRPLYGGNTAFRVDAGDRPEFVLYLPGRGGNLRLGVRTPSGAKWSHEFATTETRYRPGEMRYELRDPLLGGKGVLRLIAVALAESPGLVVRIETSALPAGTELIAAFGGANGQRGRRDGDIGTESVPIGEWFQLRPELCRDSRISFAQETFTLKAKAGELRGLFPTSVQWSVADAAHWNKIADLLTPVAAAPATPVVLGRVPLPASGTIYLGVQRADASAPVADLETYREVSAVAEAAPAKPVAVAALTTATLPPAFASAQKHFSELRGRVRVKTPDPFLNAAVSALNVAADAVWDEPQGAVMHGAIAWRTRLLGWRGPYAMDALGWTDRARRHLSYWAGRQNTSPIPDRLPPADTDSNLARNEQGLHSNGDLSNSHYDMNLVYIDAVFRHLLWTGDLKFAQEVWPMIVRHLAWERRLFRREFTHGKEKLPLYEAYAAIWASDDLQYSGGGTAHASAYNFWHNRMAAQVATLLGEDPAPYAREAELIARGMRALLWVPEEGIFAETKDWLGAQAVHPSIGLWSFYHTMDAGVPTPQEAERMMRYIDTRLPHLPVRGAAIPEGLYTLGTSTWMPYTWSLNNVVMGESLHTALGFWQGGRPEEAWRIAKGSLLASMYLGICPGNVGSMNYLDVYRRESQRDFADGSGVFSRALVEGLFGIHPDLLAGQVRIAPGFPREWESAAIHHPAIDFSYERQGRSDVYVVQPHFAKAVALTLALPVRGTASVVTIDGRTIEAKASESPFPQLSVELPRAARVEVRVTWERRAPVAEEITTASTPVSAPKLSAPSLRLTGQPEPVDLSERFNDRVTEIFRPGKYVSPRSPFVSLALPSQGIGAWAGHVNASAEIDDTGLRAQAAQNGGRFTLPNGVPFALVGPGAAPNVVFTSQWDNYPKEASIPLSGQAHRVHLLMAGSTNAMQSRFDNGEVVVTYADGGTARLALRNPETWWPIEQDYFTDDYQFRIDAPLPTRVDLKTGKVRLLDSVGFKGQGGKIPGGAATVLELPLDPKRPLRSLTVRALANDVVIGLMAATLER